MSEEKSQVVFEPIQETSGKESGYYFQGKQIIVGRRAGRPLKHKHHNEDWWPQQTKVDACTLYCVIGDLAEVSALTNVPEGTIRMWKQEPWWIDIQKQVYVEQNEKLSARISSVLDKSIEHIHDRLEHGDYFWDRRAQELKRKPIDTKTLTLLFDSLGHHRQLVRGEPTSISAKIGTDDRLEKLSEAFKRFAAAKEVEGNRLDGDNDKQLPEDEIRETEAGLSAEGQDGESNGQE